jgi:hypothetical protein
MDKADGSTSADLPLDFETVLQNDARVRTTLTIQLVWLRSSSSIGVFRDASGKTVPNRNRGNFRD